MKPEITAKLIALNSEFYQTFASHFSSTRLRLQPGVLRILDGISPEAGIFDLGCGNGELARELLRRDHRGKYIGLDFSQELLDLARRGVAGHSNFYFIHANIVDPNWRSSLTILQPRFTIITAFAALHHIPGRENHLRILDAIRDMLNPGGQLIHSNWQFLESPKLRERILPWETVGLSDEDVDEHDYLLDWRRGGIGYRYVHYYTSAELHALAEETGFKIIGLFTSDGEGNKLGLYQIWELGETP